MSINQEIIVNAIYQDGVLKPLEPLSLADNEILQLHINRPLKSQSKGLSVYKGILSGQGDFTLADIQQVRQAIEKSRLDKISNKLAEE